MVTFIRAKCSLKAQKVYHFMHNNLPRVAKEQCSSIWWLHTRTFWFSPRQRPLEIVYLISVRHSTTSIRLKIADPTVELHNKVSQFVGRKLVLSFFLIPWKQYIWSLLGVWLHQYGYRLLTSRVDDWQTWFYRGIEEGSSYFVR